MTYYYERTPDGRIGRFTDNPKVAALNGLSLVSDEAIVRGYDGYYYLSGTEPIAPEKSYREKRQESYPPLAEQLDMIYWDKVNGTTCWIDKIREIKEKFPKNI